MNETFLNRLRRSAATMPDEASQTSTSRWTSASDPAVSQLSYTHKGRSRSEYVRLESLTAVGREVETYKKFRRIIEKITDLSLEASRLRHRRK
ncbi:MAG: hypothetical protein RBS84_10280 [Kiritimatiellia bacterium]|nr:hypothetical protein [Kiritimatiellia bacterium]